MLKEDAVEAKVAEAEEEEEDDEEEEEEDLKMESRRKSLR